jgi:hypothetical protein
VAIEVDFLALGRLSMLQVAYNLELLDFRLRVVVCGKVAIVECAFDDLF